MDFFIWCLILCGISGAGTIIFSVINFHGEKQGETSELAETMSIDRKLTEFDTTIRDADDVYNNLGSLSRDVFKEFDAKYQEMLFLYNLIDDKKKELADIGEIKKEPPRAEVKAETVTESEPEPPKTNKKAAKAAAKSVPSSHMNPKYEQVMALKKEGLSVTEIAKRLKMGKGEVMLLFNLRS
jgi:hypothetical protein